DQVVVRFASEEDGESVRSRTLSDGNTGQVVGFNTRAQGRVDNFGHRPGIYSIYQAPKIKFDRNGIQVLNIKYLDMDDQEEYQRRLDQGQTNPDQDVWQSELPDTPFWEEDIVLHPQRFGQLLLKISRIDFTAVGTFG